MCMVLCIILCLIWIRIGIFHLKTRIDVAASFLSPNIVPYKQAILRSGLVNIPRGMNNFSYKTHWSWFGDGSENIEIWLNEKQLKGIIAACKQIGYKKIRDREVADEPNYYYIDNVDWRKINGYYKLEKDSEDKDVAPDFCLTVIDIKHSKIYINFSIQ